MRTKTKQRRGRKVLEMVWVLILNNGIRNRLAIASPVYLRALELKLYSACN